MSPESNMAGESMQDPNPTPAPAPARDIQFPTIDQLSVEEKNWIVGTAARIVEAQKAAAGKVEADKLAAAQHDQTKDARRERQAKAQ